VLELESLPHILFVCSCAEAGLLLPQLLFVLVGWQTCCVQHESPTLHALACLCSTHGTLGCCTALFKICLIQPLTRSPTRTCRLRLFMP